MATTYIYRTPSSTGSNTISTFSGWLKKSVNGSYEGIFTSVYETGEFFEINFEPGDSLEVRAKVSSSYVLRKITTRKFRDNSAFYHIVVVIDTTNGTAEDRCKIYVNGTRETSFSTNTNPSQNQDLKMNTAGSYEQRLGRDEWSTPAYYDGLMSHVHWVDGTAYQASTFGEIDSVSGIWIPITSPAGVSYGTNGFFFKFENSGNMDLDSSGNNLTFTTGGTLTQNVDTPSIVYNSLNMSASHLGTGITISNGGNSFNSGSTVQYGIGVCNYALNKGKWYYEYKMGHACAGGGIGDTYQVALRIKSGTALGNTTEEFAWEGNGYMKTNNGQSAYGSAASAGDIIGQYIDLDNNKMYVAVNGTIQNSGTGFSITDPNSLSSGYYYVGLISDQCSATANVTADMNYGGGYFGTTVVSSAQADANGQGIFEYSPNNGGAASFDSAAKNFYALNTKNIKEFG
jgi:hypothetical protein